MRKRYIFIITMILLIHQVLIINSYAQMKLVQTVSYYYNQFDEYDKVCRPEDNFCGWADMPKAIIYGSMIKDNITVPLNTDSLIVEICIACNGWGEGFACDYTLWNENSGMSIFINSSEKMIKIPKLSDNDIHFHHYSYYLYEYCEKFKIGFKVNSLENMSLKFQMNGGSRLDFSSVNLYFYKKI